MESHCKNQYTFLITSGGTQEPIDSVRTITNTSTGILGSLIADSISEIFQNAKIFYVCATTAARPKTKSVVCIEIKSTEDLEHTVTKLMQKQKIDAVIHSMAVSDYTVASLSSLDLIYKIASNFSSSASNVESADIDDFAKKIIDTDTRIDGKKVSSKVKYPVLLLTQTPKVLPIFRKMSKSVIIVGFKLLSNVSKDELLDTAYNLLIKDGLDFVLANDSTKITALGHKAYLVDKNKNAIEFSTKEEIANGIARSLLKKFSTISKSTNSEDINLL